MEYRKNGTRYNYLKLYQNAKHMSYDYRHKGLLNKVLPAVITQTTNNTTKLILTFIETVFVELLDYVKELQHFKNWNYKLF